MTSHSEATSAGPFGPAATGDGFRITQIGIIVEDLDRAVEAYRSTFGWGPWRIFDVVPPQHYDSELHGQPGESGSRCALATVGAIDVELIQPLTGPSQYTEFLDRNGPGLNHILVRHYSSGEEVRIDPTSLNLPLIAAGNMGPSIRYHYLDGLASLGALIEVVHGSTRESGLTPKRIISIDGEPLEDEHERVMTSTVEVHGANP